MLFTGKGDNGTTETFGSSQRMSKASLRSEALGSLDEINSFLGLAKIASGKVGLEISSRELRADTLLETIQQNLFVIQAELAGTPMTITEEKVKEMEEMIHAIEKELPPIRTFFVSGGAELAALFDVARTIARRAERRVVAVAETADVPSVVAKPGGGEHVMVGKHSLAYLNRLSSILYALARYANFKAGISENAPTYR